LDIIIAEADITFPNESDIEELATFVTAWLKSL
jgi:hypothetical protein